jgi:hypothetical protein
VKIDPDTHKGMHSVLTLKLGVTMMQLILIIFTKRKEMICYSESFRYSGKSALTNISNALTHVNVPAEDGS